MSSSSSTTTLPTPPSASYASSDGKESAAAPYVSRQPSFLARIKWAKALTLVLPLAIFAAWYFAVELKWAPPILLPSPATTWTTLLDLFADGQLLTDFTGSLSIVLKGFVWGSVIGLALGAYAGLSKWIENFFGATFDAIRQIPPLALLPLIVLWFGAGELAKLIIIAKVVFFPIFLNTVQGIRSVQKEYVEVGTVFKLTQWQFIRKIIIPGALPSILVGVRYAAGMAWATIVAAEMISGHVGLGYLIQRSQEMLFTAQMFVAVFIIASVGLIIDRALKALERYLLRWKQGYAG